jgi:hypothetical protein
VGETGKSMKAEELAVSQKEGWRLSRSLTIYRVLAERGFSVCWREVEDHPISLCLFGTFLCLRQDDAISLSA